MYLEGYFMSRSGVSGDCASAIAPRHAKTSFCVWFLWVFEHGPLLNLVHGPGHVACDKGVSCHGSAPKIEGRKKGYVLVKPELISCESGQSNKSISQAFIQSVNQSDNPSAIHQSFNHYRYILD